MESLAFVFNVEVYTQVQVFGGREGACIVVYIGVVPDVHSKLHSNFSLCCYFA